MVVYSSVPPTSEDEEELSEFERAKPTENAASLSAQIRLVHLSVFPGGLKMLFRLTN